MNRKILIGHLCSLFCAIVWGSTFLVSKTLLQVYTPAQVMLFRFALAYVALWIIHPHWHFRLKDELGFFLMSLFGNTLYFLAENSALTHTYAANVSILVSAAPVLTVLLFLLFRHGEGLTRNMLLGIFLSFLGMILVVLNGSFVLHLSPVGDLLSLSAALCWSLYNLILRRYSGNFSSQMISRKLMFYGMLTTIPIVLLQGNANAMIMNLNPGHIAGLLFLGLIGSAGCYIAWNHAVETLGVLQTNLYIYAIPFVTLAAGRLFLKEPMSVMAAFGALLIALGMVLSARKDTSSVGKGSCN